MSKVMACCDFSVLFPARKHSNNLSYDYTTRVYTRECLSRLRARVRSLRTLKIPREGWWHWTTQTMHYAGRKIKTMTVATPKGPDPISDSVLRSDQLLRETSGARTNEIGLEMISLVRSTDLQ